MKRTTLLMALISIMVINANAQADYPNVLKINPISLAFGNFNLSYQKAVSDASAIQIGANYWYNIFGTKVSGVGARGAYHFFISNREKAAPEGFYIGPQMGFNVANVTETDERVTTVGVGLMLGYQWIWESGVTLDLGAGPMYQFANETTTDESFQGFLPNITLAIGYNF